MSDIDIDKHCLTYGDTIISYARPLSVSSAMSVGQFVTSDMVSSVLDRKDNTWLQLDVCPVWRETGNCPSQAGLCCHAHPPPHIEILER